jgi:hypothetical protein
MAPVAKQVINDMPALGGGRQRSQLFHSASEGRFRAQEQAQQLIAGLSLASGADLPGAVFTLPVDHAGPGLMGSIPFALVGSVIAMWIAVSHVGGVDGNFITLTASPPATQHPQGQPLHQPVQVRGERL